MAAVIEGSRAAVFNSLAAATIGATAITATAVGLGYARARMLARGAGAVDVLFTVPSTVVGHRVDWRLELLTLRGLAAIVPGGFLVGSVYAGGCTSGQAIARLDLSGTIRTVPDRCRCSRRRTARHGCGNFSQVDGLSDRYYGADADPA